MAKIKSFKDLKKMQKKLIKKISDKKEQRTIIAVGMATCGIASDARHTFFTLMDEINNNKLHKITVVKTGCIGYCFAEPIVEVRIPGQKPVIYGGVDEERARMIIKQHIMDGKPLEDAIIERKHSDSDSVSTDSDAPFKKQLRIALKNCGKIDPEILDEYISVKGYEALGKVITEMKPDEVIAEIKNSGLRGRGGGGFLTGLKWELTSKSKDATKYIICNADEGDPGAFMDRSILEGDPHNVLEAMAVAGYAIGASNGFIYIRAEYPLAIQRLKIAITQAEEYGLLGDNIMGTDFSFKIQLKYGAGAFVCGEETSLINSIEGNRGEPLVKPPFPAEKGLWGKPTCVNNVETLANIPSILLKGSEWFSGIGSKNSKGTKVFALVGKINNVGLVEVPMGITLKEIIYDIGGGIKNNKEFKAMQTGGPSGGIIPAENINTPIDYDSLTKIGTMMGSGGMIVMDEDDCIVNIAKYYLEFTVDESCGKCTPCRVGNRRLYEILTKITDGHGTLEDLQDLKELGRIIKDTSLCGLGQTAPNPVLSTLKYFREEYISHVVDKKCPAKVCTNLIKYEIIPEKCIGCTLCAKACPVNCISGKRKEAHLIDQEECIKCGLCFEKCPVDAIEKK